MKLTRKGWITVVGSFALVGFVCALHGAASLGSNLGEAVTYSILGFINFTTSIWLGEAKLARPENIDPSYTQNFIEEHSHA